MASGILERLHRLLDDRDRDGLVLALTGAGVSAESGIPTFRGPEGYWRVGSRNYRPEELATHAAFRRMPDQLWGWYLHRRSACLGAEPNPAHRALAELERELGPSFVLATQNVDGLHLRAGSSPERTWQIHGNLHYARCADDCGAEIREVPGALSPDWPRDRAPTPAELELLHCERCGGWLRPHVLWFDECYDERHYRFDSSLAASERAAVLLVLGTSGATSLPQHLVQRAAARGIPFIVLSPDPSPFSALAESHERGSWIAGTAVEWVPRIAARLARGAGGAR